MSRRDTFNPVAEEIPFDNTGSSFESDNVQGALLEAGNVVGPSVSDDNAIARYDGITGKLIQNSKAFVQDGGALTAQGYILNKQIIDVVTIQSNFAMIVPSFSIELTGELIIDADGEIVIV